MLIHLTAIRWTFGIFALLVASLANSPVGAAERAATSERSEWRSWRGPLSGSPEHRRVPTRWSATENIKWKTPLENPGNSTPIIVGQKVLVTAANADGSQRSLLCFDLATGKLQWQQDVTAKAKELTHETNPYAASSPVSDGTNVYVWHGSAGVLAYDLAGKRLWQKDLGEFTHIWGYASSPIVVDGKVILYGGPGVRVLITALDVRSGDEVWKRDLPEAQSKDEKEFKGAWSTPTIYVPQGGAPQVLMSLPGELRAFAAANGADLWTCKGLSSLSYTSPLVTGDKEPVAVAMSGYTGPALACKLGGTGDITEKSRLWLHDQKNPQHIGSGTIVDGYVYLLNENGVAWCAELATGKKQWEERISTPSWSSMTYIDGRIYVANMQGETLVLKPNAEKCEVLATNKLDGEMTRASLAFAGSRIVIRSYKHLYCIEDALDK